jgi:hypothetical protein
VAPNSLHRRIKECWAEYHSAETDNERDAVCQRLLSHLGTLRQITGTKSISGRKAADQMNSLRQQRDRRQVAAQERRQKAREAEAKTPPKELVDAPF